jgi:hypothetical protein
MRSVVRAAAFVLLSIGSASADPTPMIPATSGPTTFSNTEIHFRGAGAAGNGVADDTAAINSAFTAARTALAAGGGGVEIVCDPGVYKITGPINATGLAAYPATRPIVISGPGCLIDAHFSGAPIIDALGDTAVTFRDFALYGDVAPSPASFTATISGVVLNVTAISSGAISVGAHVAGAGVTPGTIVTATGTGTGGIGTYMISVSSTVGSSESMSSYSGPTTGIQIGRLSTGSSDRNVIDEVTVSGNFTIAACYNLASETTHYNHVRCYNSNSDPQSYGAIWDGINHFSIQSPFQAQTLGANVANVSLDDDVCTDCDIHSNAGGPTVWLAQIQRIFFDGGYILNQNGQPGFVLYAGVGSLQYLHVNIHMELGTMPENFLITGTSSSPTVQGLEYEDQTNFASTSLIALDASSGVTSATIRELRISIGTFIKNSVTVFDNPSGYTIFGGTIHLPSPTNWNNPASFSGTVFTAGIAPSGQGATLNYGGGSNTATGLNATVCGGAQNVASGSAAFACGLGDIADGSYDVSLGDGALAHGRLGIMCHGSSNSTPGQTQSCSGQMQAAGTTPMQLTANAAAGDTSNEFNVTTSDTTFGFALRISCRDITTPGNDVSALWLNLMLSRDAGASTTTLTAASKTTPDYIQTRGAAAFTWALAADTTNAGLSVTALPPNADTWHCGAQVLPSIEVQ